MDLLNTMLAVLVKAQSDAENREDAVKKFQSLVWDSPRPIINQDIDDVLGDLAYDLDFFVPNPVHRRQDPSYYGEERLKKEISAAMKRLAEFGVAVPDNE